MRAFPTAPPRFSRLRRGLARICPHLPYLVRSRVAVSCAPLGGTRPRRPGLTPRRERKGGFQVNAHYAKKGTRRSASDRGGAAPLSPDGTCLSRPGIRREECAVNFRKIPKNTVNTDKFTGFFDKFPNGKNIASYCNKRISNTILSAVDSNMTGKIF